MSSGELFRIVTAGGYALPVVVTLVFLFLPIRGRAFFRMAAAVLVAWLSSIFYTALVYNPAGISAGVEAGEHFPHVRFDNNSIAVTLVAGWLVPTCIAVAWYALLGRRAAQPGAPDDARP